MAAISGACQYPTAVNTMNTAPSRINFLRKLSNASMSFSRSSILRCLILLRGSRALPRHGVALVFRMVSEASVYGKTEPFTRVISRGPANGRDDDGWAPATPGDDT